MRSLSAFRGKLERDRQRAGLSVARLSWMLGVSVREYPGTRRGRSVAVLCGLGANRGVLGMAADVLPDAEPDHQLR
jgi:hypothetical protein